MLPLRLPNSLIYWTDSLLYLPPKRGGCFVARSLRSSGPIHTPSHLVHRLCAQKWEADSPALVSGKDSLASFSYFTQYWLKWRLWSMWSCFRLSRLLKLSTERVVLTYPLPVDDICALGLRTKVEIYAEVICFILVAFLAKNTIQNTLMHSQFLQINLRQFTGCKRQALLRTLKELWLHILTEVSVTSFNLTDNETEIWRNESDLTLHSMRFWDSLDCS